MVAQKEETGLYRGLRLIYVYAIVTGAILGPFGVWSGTWFANSGPSLGISIITMMIMLIPIGLVYSELASMLPKVGGELVYNAVGFNSRHVGFWAAWLMFIPWMTSTPAIFMYINEGLKFLFFPEIPTANLVIIAVICVLVVLALNLIRNVTIGIIQTIVLFVTLFSTALTVVIFFTSGHWDIANLTPFVRSVLAGGGATGAGGMKGWLIGTALLVTPFFGFEIVPQMVEEGTYPVRDHYKAIIGSIVSCAIVYFLMMMANAGMAPWEWITGNGTGEPFVEVRILQQIIGWNGYAIFFGVVSVVLTLATCIFGFWMACVRMLYAMGRHNFLPKAFTKVNKNGQPVTANIVVAVVAIAYILFMYKAGSYIQDYFTMMAFGSSCAYALTMISSIIMAVRKKGWNRPFTVPGGMVVRIIALIFACTIAILTTLGQSLTAWQGILYFLGLGVIIWIWMLIRWRKEKPWLYTPEGKKEF